MADPVDDDPRPETVVRIVTVICLTVIVIVALIGITVTANLTDRDVHYAEGLSFGGTVVIAVLGGFTFASLRRHRRRHWRIEHDEEGDDE